MSRRKKSTAPSSSKASSSAQAKPRSYRAGCGRQWELSSAEDDLAYTEQAFAECSSCLHRVEPEGALPFCTLRPSDAPHPFAALAGLLG